MSVLIARRVWHLLRGLRVGEEMKVKLREVFALDLRALAVFRACIGALVCADVVLRMNDLNAFYTDQGWLLGDHAQAPSMWHFQLCWHRTNSSAVFQVRVLKLHTQHPR
jgi:hypothetical protein